MLKERKIIKIHFFLIWAFTITVFIYIINLKGGDHMKIKNEYIINAFTNLDELMQGKRNGPLMFIYPKEMFEMGQFYEWAKHIVENDDIDLEAATEVPEEFAWVVGKVLRW